MTDLKEYTFYDKKVIALNLENYYLHSTGGNHGIYNKKDLILTILRHGAIDPNFQGDNPIIYLSDPNKKEIISEKKRLSSCFQSYVEKSPTICLDRELEVYDPNYSYTYANSNDTFLYDEVRHKGQIGIDKFKLITFPIWPIGYELVGGPYYGVMFNKYWKIENLEIFKNNLEILQRDFNTMRAKDLYTGIDLTTDFIDERIKELKKL